MYGNITLHSLCYLARVRPVARVIYAVFSYCADLLLVCWSNFQNQFMNANFLSAMVKFCLFFKIISMLLLFIDILLSMGLVIFILTVQTITY